MAFTTTQLAALEAAIGTGELSISYDGKTISYRSMPELIAAHKFVKDALIAAGTLTSSALSNRGPSSVATFSRD